MGAVVEGASGSPSDAICALPRNTVCHSSSCVRRAGPVGIVSALGTSPKPCCATQLTHLFFVSPRVERTFHDGHRRLERLLLPLDECL